MTYAKAYDPLGSGMLLGGGPRHPKMRKSAIVGYTKNFPDMHLSECKRIREEVPDFEEGIDYSARELQLITEKILLCDPKPPNEDPVWLNAPVYLDRCKREIYSSQGTVDPSYGDGLYWRTHPNGRKWWTPDQRRAGGNSFYR